MGALIEAIFIVFWGALVGMASTFISYLLAKRRARSHTETVEVRSSSGKLIGTVEVNTDMSKEATQQAVERIREIGQGQMRHVGV